MSGAFSVDVEVGASPDDPDFFKFYCATLTDVWTKDRKESEIPQIVAQLGGEDSIKDILPRRPNVKNLPEIEAYFGALACQLRVLKLPIFQEFLGIPESVSGGLGYVSEIPFGKTVFAGELQKHARHLRQGGGKRYVRLTRESKTGSLILYRDKHSKEIIGSFNLAPNSTKCDLVPRVNNGFVLKNSNRQWVFQATNRKEFGNWLTNLGKILGQSKVPQPPSAQGDEEKEVLREVTGKDIGQLHDEEETLKRQTELLQNQLDGMNQEIKNLRYDKEQLNLSTDELKLEIEKEFGREAEELVKDYKIQNDNLKDVIKELKAGLTAKPSVPSVAPKTFGFGNLFKKDDADSGEPDQEIEELIQIDIERKMLRQLHDNERLEVKHQHKHLHRHSHKHIHEHRHTHIDKDMKEQGLIPDHIEFNNKHKLVHNITHTNTQMILEGGAKVLGVKT